MENEFRCFDIEDLELRAEKRENGETVISGYAARFNSWSEDLGGFRERIKPGAFSKALLSSDVRLLFNHSADRGVLGRTPRTLTLVEDTKGLRFEGKLPDTQLARDLVISINRKDITGNSFSFVVGEGGDEWNEKDGMTSRTITEFKEIFDIGPVVFPAYDSAKVKVSSRALDKVKEIKAAAISGDDTGAIVRAKDEGVNLEIDILTKTRKSGGELKC
uniref:Putative peptidase n=1 Tax=viral metagenome TaxID=1070528 RepID=A0A6M3K3V4_9ZZZZ